MLRKFDLCHASFAVHIRTDAPQHQLYAKLLSRQSHCSKLPPASSKSRSVDIACGHLATVPLAECTSGSKMPAETTLTHPSPPWLARSSPPRLQLCLHYFRSHLQTPRIALHHQAERFAFCLRLMTFLAGRCTGGGAMPMVFCSCRICPMRSPAQRTSTQTRCWNPSNL